MTFPNAAVIACDGLYAANVALAKGSDDERRTLTRKIAEQVAFMLGPRWGNKKRHGLGDEWQSKDALAYREDDGTLTVWDWQNGDTRKRGVNEGAEGLRLPANEADFMPVTPTNHLGSVTPPVTPPGVPPVTPSFDLDVRASLGRVEVEQGAAKARQDVSDATQGRLEDKLDRLQGTADQAAAKKAPDYAGTQVAAGKTVTLKPKK